MSATFVYPDGRNADGRATGKVTRRYFLKLVPTAGAGLAIGIHFSSLLAAEPEGEFAPNVYLKIDPKGRTTIVITRSEMGQGVVTSLAMLVAEEAEVDWSKVRFELAMADKAKYGDQGTGASESIQALYEPLRKAGAAAREMLVAAAAQQWNVAVAECRAEKGLVLHPGSNRKRGYGSLVEAACKLEVPKEPKLKDAKSLRLLGSRARRLDTPDKVKGTATFGIDVRVPGMMYAALARCPVFGGKLVNYNDAKAKAVPGVRQVVRLQESVAVVAENTWAAFQGRDALEVNWDEGPNAKISSSDIRSMFEEKLKADGVVWLTTGDAAAAHAAAAKSVQGLYEVPFLSHSPMEPQNCTAHVTAERCEVWAPTQGPQDVQDAVAQALGIKPEQVIEHITLMGGGFGRRLFTDPAVEAALAAKAAGVPVKVMWTREEDTQFDFFRPASFHALRASFGSDGWPVAFEHKVVAPSILEQNWPNPSRKGDDPVIFAQTPYVYDTANVRLEYVMANTFVPAGWWRSVYASQSAFATESFVDEMAAAAGKDPFEFRRRLLAGERMVESGRDSFDTARLRGVLELAAAKAGWGKPLPKGRGRGIACYPSFGSYTAAVVEASVADGEVRVHRAVCAVDCGMRVNSAIIESQMESAVVYGLSSLRGEITIENGRPKQSNFHDYPMLRINEMPKVEVHIVDSMAKPGGVGEPGVAPVAPAVVNAIFAASGKRIRRLPLTPEALA